MKLAFIFNWRTQPPTKNVGGMIKLSYAIWLPWGWSCHVTSCDWSPQKKYYLLCMSFLYGCDRIQLLKFIRCCAVFTAKALWGQKSVSNVDGVCAYILLWSNLMTFVPPVHIFPLYGAQGILLICRSSFNQDWVLNVSCF